MASACLNSLSPENLLERPQKYSSYGNWFRSRLSISSDSDRISPAKNLPEVTDPAKKLSDPPEESDTNEFDGFEFRLEDPVTMLPADELFSDGKLVPLQFTIRQEPATSTTTTLSGVRRKTDDAFTAGNDPYLYSPRAPRCSSRWKELLGFRKQIHQSNNHSHSPKADTKRSIRHLLYRTSKSSNESPIHSPLLTDTESVTVSSRPSLSSSSSGHDIDDVILPRLSLDSDKPRKSNSNKPNRNHNPNPNPNPNTRPKTNTVKTRMQSMDTRVGRSTVRRSTDAVVVTSRGLSMDSPRMSSSGKIVFHSLERSSSSPSTLIGGQRLKNRGMERSYSGNVRVAPVLNVKLGFPMFSTGGNNGGLNRGQRLNVKG